MAKKRKKIRRPQTPPLSWADKAIYGALVLLLLGGMVLAIVLMDALHRRSAVVDRLREGDPTADGRGTFRFQRQHREPGAKQAVNGPRADVPRPSDDDEGGGEDCVLH